jgi:exonuclease SbcC
MRPLKLELKGFTAFREPATIDFTGLDVFAISGPTGSGKSSILDALTYALYGRVERVGDRVGQLISQGQPRMAVTLEFEVGHDRFQLTRSTPAKGATKIQLMRQGQDGGWVQAGEGSDRVREAERILARVIGLTYDGFTRSVLLPQGRFAEFLVGDARKRRDILTELLGLSLFRRMAERAGTVGKEAADRARWTGEMLQDQFADATTQALAEARTRARDAERREKALAKAAAHLVEILARWQESKRTAEELGACAEEAAAAAAQAGEAAEELLALAERLDEESAETDRRASERTAAEQALKEARAAILEAEDTLGQPARLEEARIWGHSLRDAGKAIERKKRERVRAADAALVLASSLEAAERTVADSRAGFAAREAELALAEAAMEAARHADLVATVSAGLKAGDPCPVCGQPLEKAPRSSRRGGLESATKGLAEARTRMEVARGLVGEGERATDGARRDVEANAAEQQRLAVEAAELDGALAEAAGLLEGVLGHPLPEDPAAAVEARLAELRRLDRAERDATTADAEARHALLRAEQDRTRLTAGVERVRDRLAVDHGPLLDRSARASGASAARARARPKLPPPPETGEARALERHADALAASLTALAERLAGELAERSPAEDRLLQEAMEKVGALVEPAPNLEALAASVNDACRAATLDVATTAKDTEDLAARLERRKQLEGEVKELEYRAVLLRKLAQELRADHLVAFLQAEALQVLAIAGSDRLAGLSDGRYRLVCREDEFLVVDMWNGDEERSVRTLSGGETFLASLALALALADQVRSLSVTDRARLDSLFLDEGFGTLDPESLRTVTDAIEQLAGDGRLVGVITHVKELAEQFPRIEVEKSPLGSRLQLVP